MSRALLSLAVHAYVLAAIVYLAHLVRQKRALATAGRLLVGTGLVLQGVGLGSALVEQGGVPDGLGQGLGAVSFLLLAIFFALDLRHRLPVMGAFITPLAVAILVPAQLLPKGSSLPASLQGPLLPVHISIALLGMAAFAIAAGVALMYLLMERQMKGKHFGLLFSRLPSLNVLDELNRHLVVWGFVALSVTLITGAVLFYGASGGVYWQWEPRQVATALAWLLFAVLLNARFFAGWQGRRAAVLTMAGFCVLVVSFLYSYDPHRQLGAFR